MNPEVLAYITDNQLHTTANDAMNKARQLSQLLRLLEQAINEDFSALTEKSSFEQCSIYIDCLGLAASVCGELYDVLDTKIDRYLQLP